MERSNQKKKERKEIEGKKENTMLGCSDYSLGTESNTVTYQYINELCVYAGGLHKAALYFIKNKSPIELNVIKFGEK